MWGSYLGGAANDSATAAALDSSANFWVAGNTKSTEFPNVNGWSTGEDFMVAFNATGGLTYSGRYPTGTVKAPWAVPSKAKATKPHCGDWFCMNASVCR